MFKEKRRGSKEVILQKSILIQMEGKYDFLVTMFLKNPP